MNVAVYVTQTAVSKNNCIGTDINDTQPYFFLLKGLWFNISLSLI